MTTSTWPVDSNLVSIPAACTVPLLRELTVNYGNTSVLDVVPAAYKSASGLPGAQVRPGLTSGSQEAEGWSLRECAVQRDLVEQARSGVPVLTVHRETDEEPKVRSQGFRRAVLGAYSHRCAFCGVRVLTSDGRTSVDGAHIIPWAVSHNDDPRNGLALCRLCHWVFDVGLIGVKRGGTIILSPDLDAARNIPGHLLTLSERRILGPEEEQLWPDPDALCWHREKIFGRR